MLTSSLTTYFTRSLAACLPLTLTFLLHSAQAQVPKLSSYPAARATVYLDFDGHTARGTAWNWDGDIVAKPSGLSPAEITQIFNRVAEDFRIFNINITTDATVFTKAPVAKRVRIIFTPTHQWYGQSGGIAFVNSFSWGDDTPAWVFVSLLSGDPKYIAEAASHEIGHTFGLQHQSTYSNTCALISEYGEGRGTGEIGWAPIMGLGYYKNFTTWTYGSSIEGCKVMQNDIAIISGGYNNIGFRSDDHGNTRQAATNVLVTNDKFHHTGVINSATDKDFFKLVLARKSRLTMTVIPNNVGPGNSGANVDIVMTLVKSSGDTIARVNPGSLLSTSIDTLLLAGTYYIGVDGAGNQNVSDYGSVGMYSLGGTVTAVTAMPVKPLVITGSVRPNIHLLRWESGSLESTTRGYLETSFDGIHYLPVSSTPLTGNLYEHVPSTNRLAYYRLRMVLPDESEVYSNTVALSSTSPVTVFDTRVTSTIELSSNGNYNYMVVDAVGRVIEKGRVANGLNSIALRSNMSGVLVRKVFDSRQQFNFRLVKR